MIHYPYIIRYPWACDTLHMGVLNILTLIPLGPNGPEGPSVPWEGKKDGEREKHQQLISVFVPVLPVSHCHNQENDCSMDCYGLFHGNTEYTVLWYIFSPICEPWFNSYILQSNHP